VSIVYQGESHKKVKLTKSEKSLILDEGKKVKLRIQNREHAKQFPELAADDPTLLEHVKKAMGFVEFFEKHPELSNKIEGYD
jgi:hypothetical protein